ncbi:MAG TPA: hypothetical protein DHV36_16125 [Desulfobacteraceae bacterium]|nr:hypothetical protein [Desulfobacteraceae bacterium]|tara:strand:+ start:2304 stop:2702 length:399 start_codon:yes stop_codon:yes gene_type:complete
MIRKMTVEDIAKILKLEDDVFETVFHCTIGEWVQFLARNVENDNFLMLGVFSEDVLAGYIVCSSSVFPPVSYHVGILYYVGTGEDNAAKVLPEIKKFAQGKNANSIRFITRKPEAFSKYGFIITASLMEMAV